MRLFTAVELPGDVRTALAAAARPLLASMAGARPVAEENLHVTVTFLGETPGQALPPIRAALLAAAQTCPSGTVRVRGFGAFPSLRAPRVVWAGLDDPQETLRTLERAVAERLAAVGVPPEGRSYTPHVTVARIDDRRRARGTPAPATHAGALRSAVDRGASDPIGPEFVVRDLVLFVSEAPHGGPVRYRALDRFPLPPQPGA